MKTMEQLIADLESLIPTDVIQEREGGNGKMLSYLPGFYVIDRLNKTIGQGFWSYGSEVYKLHEQEITKEYSGRKTTSYYVSYRAKVELSVKFPNGETCQYIDVGFGDGQDSKNAGKAHELAIKEAVTDGLKRCARCLGNSMGNGLYDRSGAGIGDETETKETPTAPTLSKVIPRQKLLDLVSANSKIIVSKGLMTVDKLKEKMKNEYGVSDKSELDDAALLKFKLELETTAKQTKGN